jgi:hypothetical protein
MAGKCKRSKRSRGPMWIRGMLVATGPTGPSPKPVVRRLPNIIKPR